MLCDLTFILLHFSRSTESISTDGCFREMFINNHSSAALSCGVFSNGVLRMLSKDAMNRE